MELQSRMEEVSNAAYSHRKLQSHIGHIWLAAEDFTAIKKAENKPGSLPGTFDGM